jgi:predicted DNA binding CopG/RHH family protein
MKRQPPKTNSSQVILDAEEKLWEDIVKRGDYEIAPHFAATKKMLEVAAREQIYLHTAKPVTLRIKQIDLIRVKAKAKAKHIPYQTLLGTLIHQYADDQTHLAL